MENRLSPCSRYNKSLCSKHRLWGRATRFQVCGRRKIRACANRLWTLGICGPCEKNRWVSSTSRCTGRPGRSMPGGKSLRRRRTEWWIVRMLWWWSRRGVAGRWTESCGLPAAEEREPDEILFGPVQGGRKAHERHTCWHVLDSKSVYDAGKALTVCCVRKSCCVLQGIAAVYCWNAWEAGVELGPGHQGQCGGAAAARTWVSAGDGKQARNKRFMWEAFASLLATQSLPGHVVQFLSKQLRDLSLLAIKKHAALVERSERLQNWVYELVVETLFPVECRTIRVTLEKSQIDHSQLWTGILAAQRFEKGNVMEN